MYVCAGIKCQKIENQVYDINTSQTHGGGEIVMKKNMVYGGRKHGKDKKKKMDEGMDSKNTEYDYVTN